MLSNREPRLIAPANSERNARLFRIPMPVAGSPQVRHRVGLVQEGVPRRRSDVGEPDLRPPRNCRECERTRKRLVLIATDPRAIRHFVVADFSVGRLSAPRHRMHPNRLFLYLIGSGQRSRSHVRRGYKLCRRRLTPLSQNTPASSRRAIFGLSRATASMTPGYGNRLLLLTLLLLHAMSAPHQWHHRHRTRILDVARDFHGIATDACRNCR